MTTETENGKEAGKPQTSGRVKIEWNWDLDDEWLEMKSIGSGDQKYVLGEEGRSRLKGRCRRCWGRLIGKREAGDELMAIQCRVCDRLLEGDEAREEYEQMSKEGGLNTVGLVLGVRPKYRDDATFVQKTFHHIDRLSVEEFSQRVRDEEQKRTPQEGVANPQFVSRRIRGIPVPAGASADVRGRATPQRVVCGASLERRYA